MLLPQLKPISNVSISYLSA